MVTSTGLRVAVVGSGPAGIYTANELVTAHPDITVDIFERLPVPMGLLRYGVAPDHTAIKSAAAVFEDVLAHPAVRLFCNVEVGGALSVDDLRQRYHAVVYATGASTGERLGIPGEDLQGSHSAAAFVAWYNGHPDAAGFRLRTVRAVGVVGAGNVALDVARMLLKAPVELRCTDIPAPVLDELESSAVTDVHLFVRRGAADTKFTTKELRELGGLAGVDIVVDPAHVAGARSDGLPAAAARNLNLFHAWSERPLSQAPRRMHLHFEARPVAVLGADRVTAIRLERSAEPVSELSLDLLLRSIGYRPRPIAGVPSVDDTGTVPHRGHRVERDGEIAAGEYAVGWVKRGATGVLGTNRADAEETAAAILADHPALLRRLDGGDADVLVTLLAERGVTPLDYGAWQAIARSENELGARLGRTRVKLHEWEALLAAGRS
ncbi:FAD-dependent oxidoreductase [Rhodococcus koreensis]